MTPKPIDLDYKNTETEAERGYAEGRTEVYLNRNDHMDVKGRYSSAHSSSQLGVELKAFGIGHSSSAV